MRAPIEHVVVVVPARDEERLIDRCLRSVAVACGAVDGPSVQVVVVLDDCRDGTRAMSSRFDVELCAIDAGSVGVARAHGVSRGLAESTASAGRTWIASTDADSQVPPQWLTCQLALAQRGADVVVGTVRPDPSDLTAAEHRAWSATRVPGRPNGHVHGANLGIRADAYLRAGGFLPQDEHEDVDLVARIARDPLAVVVASDECDVLTSGRRVGRTPGGYARYLRTALSG